MREPAVKTDMSVWNNIYPLNIKKLPCYAASLCTFLLSQTTGAFRHACPKRISFIGAFQAGYCFKGMPLSFSEWFGSVCRKKQKSQRRRTDSSMFSQFAGFPRSPGVSFRPLTSIRYDVQIFICKQKSSSLVPFSKFDPEQTGNLNCGFVYGTRKCRRAARITVAGPIISFST